MRIERYFDIDAFDFIMVNGILSDVMYLECFNVDSHEFVLGFQQY